MIEIKADGNDCEIAVAGKVVDIAAQFGVAIERLLSKVQETYEKGDNMFAQSILYSLYKIFGEDEIIHILSEVITADKFLGQMKDMFNEVASKKGV